jgi:ribonuclease HI
MTSQEVQEGVSEAFQPNQAASPAQEAASSQGPASHAPTGAGQRPAAPRALWSEAAELAEARERSQWHELMSRRNIEQNEKLQVKLILVTSFC